MEIIKGFFSDLQWVKRVVPIVLALFMLSGCIGTDIIDDPIMPVRLTIQPRIDSIRVGETVQFSGVYENELGQEEEQAITWMSSDPQHVSISPDGLAEGIVADSAMIIASANGAVDTLFLNMDGVTNQPQARTGNFQGVGSYSASGDVSLEVDGNGDLKVIFASNFSASAGPSVYLVLANNTNGNYAITPGGNAVSASSAQITPNRMTNFSGAMQFDVPDGIGIQDYDYAVLYCVIGPVFGFAPLN